MPRWSLLTHDYHLGATADLRVRSRASSLVALPITLKPLSEALMRFGFFLEKS